MEPRKAAVTHPDEPAVSSPGVLGPIVLCGAITAVFSALPVVGLLNFVIPGLWFWAGGIIVSFILVSKGARPDTTYGAVVGFLTAAFGALLLVVIDIILTITGVAAAVAGWYYKFLPEATAVALEKIGIPLDPVPPGSAVALIKMAFMALLIWLLAAATFGTLGGAIGVWLGKSRAGTQPGGEA